MKRSKIKNQQSKIENQKSKIKNQQSKIKNQKSKIKNRKSKMLLLGAVDLSLLQAVGVIHVHRLPLAVEVDGADAAFAVSIARGLDAAEGQVNFCPDGRSVDVGDAGVQVAHGLEGAIHVASVDRRGEAVLDVV